MEGPQRTNTKEKSTIELMQAREENARTLLQLETTLSAKSLDSSDKNGAIGTMQAVNALADELRKRGFWRETNKAKNAILEYREMEYTARALEQTLLSRIDNSRPANLAMGEFVFKEMTGVKPQGSPSAKRFEGYLILTIENDEDFEVFYPNKQDAKYPESEQTVVSGVYIYDATLLRYEDVKILTVRKGEEQAQALIHERQHFINKEILESFEDIESVGITNSTYPLLGRENIPNNRLVSLRRVKDEILARIREGSDALGSIDFLKRYHELRRKFGEKQETELIDIVQEIGYELEETLPFYPTLADRGILVYSLVDIPLTRMPGMLRAIRMHKSKESKAT